MKPSEDNIKEIKALFCEMKTREDLLALLNRAKELYYGESVTPFEAKSLTYYSNPKLAKNSYKEFSVKKKNGGFRKIHSPIKGLKSIQIILNFVLQCVFEPHQAAKGFIWKKSIVDNARVHEGQHYVFNIDLKDFFPSIDQARVWKRLQYPPFNLNHENGNIEIANRIAGLCCTEMEVERKNKDDVWETVKRNVLPQGAPTSPTFTNIIAQNLDHKLSGLAKRFNLNYSRYADDITFSSMHNVYQHNSDFRNELHRIIENQNFYINPKKTRLQKTGFRQEVTGLVVNEKANVHQRYLKQIRMWLYYWEKYDYEKAEQIFKRDYISDKGHIKNINAHLVNVLDGKLEFLKMVKGIEDGTYKGLKERFNKLTGLKETKDQSKIDLNSVLNTLVNQGLNKAMNLYSRFKNQ